LLITFILLAGSVNADPRSRSCGSSERALEETKPPHGLKRGKLFFSRITVEKPASAASAALSDPAGPAPITARSYFFAACLCSFLIFSTNLSFCLLAYPY